MKKTSMNRIFFIGLFISGWTSGFAQSQDENYIYTKEPLVPVSTVNSNTEAIRVVQYFDGLGRPKQTVQVGGHLLQTANREI